MIAYIGGIWRVEYRRFHTLQIKMNTGDFILCSSQRAKHKKFFL
jgi:hypothetical protein